MSEKVIDKNHWVYGFLWLLIFGLRLWFHQLLKDNPASPGIVKSHNVQVKLKTLKLFINTDKQDHDCTSQAVLWQWLGGEGGRGTVMFVVGSSLQKQKLPPTRKWDERWQ